MRMKTRREEKHRVTSDSLSLLFSSHRCACGTFLLLTFRGNPMTYSASKKLDRNDDDEIIEWFESVNWHWQIRFDTFILDYSLTKSNSMPRSTAVYLFSDENNQRLRRKHGFRKRRENRHINWDWHHWDLLVVWFAWESSDRQLLISILDRCVPLLDRFSIEDRMIHLWSCHSKWRDVRTVCLTSPYHWDQHLAYEESVSLPRMTMTMLVPMPSKTRHSLEDSCRPLDQLGLFLSWPCRSLWLSLRLNEDEEDDETRSWCFRVRCSSWRRARVNARPITWDPRIAIWINCFA